MGADLYLRSLYEKQEAEWRPRFDEAVKERNRTKRGTPEYEAAQQRVEECYEQLHGLGYFRDAYNDWDVLWRFGLSWWNDVSPLLSRGRWLSVENAERVVSLLAQREDEFKDNMAECSAEDRVYFEGKAKALRAFLNLAIELGEPIDCSL